MFDFEKKCEKNEKTKINRYKSKKNIKAGRCKRKKKNNGKEKTSKNKKPDRDLLEILQNEYKDNSYVQKISKTFFKRRLFKNIIYRHNFEYKEDGSIEENKTRSSGESTIYKYGKFTFKFKNDEYNPENFDKLVKLIGEDLKQCFTKIDDENKDYIIGGKISCLILEFLNKTMRKNLYNDFNVVKVCVEFYEFYEELISEFDDKESNVKIIKCEEKIYNNLKKDWESLQLVRDFVNKNKKTTTIENMINNVNKNEDNNNEKFDDNSFNNDENMNNNENIDDNNNEINN